MRLFSVLITIIMTVCLVQSYGQLREEALGTQPAAKSIHISPNPTNDLSEYVSIYIAPLKTQKVKLILRNIIGNEIAAEYEAVDEHELKMRVKDLAPGFYLVTIKDTTSNFRGTYKFLKR